jgi:hypothetical protein
MKLAMLCTLYSCLRCTGARGGGLGDGRGVVRHILNAKGAIHEEAGNLNAVHPVLKMDWQAYAAGLSAGMCLCLCRGCGVHDGVHRLAHAQACARAHVAVPLQ